MKDSVNRLTIVAIFLLLMFVVMLSALSLHYTKIRPVENNCSNFVPVSQPYSDVESCLLSSEAHSEQPQPREQLSYDYRCIGLTPKDYSSDIDTLLDYATIDGFNYVMLELGDNCDPAFVSQIAEMVYRHSMKLQIQISSALDEELIDNCLSAAGDITGVVFLGDITEASFSSLKDFIYHNNNNVIVGYGTSYYPNNARILAEIADFILVTSSNPSDIIMTRWDSTLIGTDTPLLSNFIVTTELMDNSPSYLPELQMQAFSTVNYRGTVVSGISDAYSDTSGSFTAFIDCINGENLEYIGSGLAIIEPARTDYSTYGKVFTVRGSGNPLYSLTVNGKSAQMTGAGIFSWSCDLDVGENTIEISHMGDTIVYTVDRKVDVIKSVNPSKNISADGGVTITLSVYAMCGSNVIAKINGKTYTLIEENNNPENESDDNTDEYVKFSTTLTLPEGQREDQILGKVTFKGTFDGYTETVTGGRITVNALPEPEPEKEIVQIATVKVSHSDGVNMAKTFNPKLLDDNSLPTHFYLTKGMKDVITKEISIDIDGNNITYLVLSSGVMIHKSDCIITDEEKPVNHITSASFTEENGKTSICIKSDLPVAAVTSLLPQKFTGRHPRGYSINSFSATRVEIMFPATVSVSNILGFTDNKLFSKYEWVKVNDEQYILALTLKKPGAFYGFSTQVDSKGRTILSFKNPVTLNKADNDYGYSLEGIKVVLDAGHNGNYPYNPGAAGFYDGLHEANLNLILAEKTKDKLESLGANVVLTRTDNACGITNDERVNKIISADADVCIAIHHNGATSQKGYGTSAYYFYPFAKDLSESVYKHMVEMYQSVIYPTGERKDGCAMGCSYYPYYMTRIQEYPCILVEAGYVTNLIEYEFLIRDDIQDSISNAFTKGIIDFLASQDYV